MLACNKNPLGEDELSERGIIDPIFLKLAVDSFETCYTAPSQGKSLNLVLGRNRDYESRILLKFSFPDSFPSDIEDIRMTLYKRKTMRDDTLEFNIYLLTSAWTEYYTTWQLSDESMRWLRPGGDFDPTPVLSKIASGDSVDVRFTKDQLNLVKNSEGIILLPLRDGFNTFQSREAQQRVRLTYKSGNQRVDVPLAADVHIINDSLPEPYRKIWIGSGIPFRAFCYLKPGSDQPGSGKRSSWHSYG